MSLPHVGAPAKLSQGAVAKPSQRSRIVADTPLGGVTRVSVALASTRFVNSSLLGQQMLRNGTNMRTKSFFAAAACGVALAGASAGAASAGEVTGPPGTPGVPFSGSEDRTGAPENANSICAYNGLNDLNPEQGPIDSIVQTPLTRDLLGKRAMEPARAAPTPRTRRARSRGARLAPALAGSRLDDVVGEPLEVGRRSELAGAVKRPSPADVGRSKAGS